MILANLMDCSLSEWEEKMLAVLFLSERELKKQVLTEEGGKRIEAALTQMKSLPRRWCKEICLEILLVADSKA